MKQKTKYQQIAFPPLPTFSYKQETNQTSTAHVNTHLPHYLPVQVHPSSSSTAATATAYQPDHHYEQLYYHGQGHGQGQGQGQGQGYAEEYYSQGGGQWR